MLCAMLCLRATAVQLLPLLKQQHAMRVCKVRRKFRPETVANFGFCSTLQLPLLIWMNAALVAANGGHGTARATSSQSRAGAFL